MISAYDETLKAVASSKEKILRMELAVSRGKKDEARDTIIDLNSAMEKLDRLAGSLILRSKSAWEEYEKLEGNCEVLGFKPTALADLRAACVKTERLAADLLCYSLGRFRLKSGSTELELGE